MLSFEIIKDIKSKKLPIELYYRELKSYSENFEVLGRLVFDFKAYENDINYEFVFEKLPNLIYHDFTDIKMKIKNHMHQYSKELDMLDFHANAVIEFENFTQSGEDTLSHNESLKIRVKNLKNNYKNKLSAFVEKYDSLCEMKVWEFFLWDEIHYAFYFENIKRISDTEFDKIKSEIKTHMGDCHHFSLLFKYNDFQTPLEKFIKKTKLQKELYILELTDFTQKFDELHDADIKIFSLEDYESYYFWYRTDGITNERFEEIIFEILEHTRNFSDEYNLDEFSDNAHVIIG